MYHTDAEFRLSCSAVFFLKLWDVMERFCETNRFFVNAHNKGINQIVVTFSRHKDYTTLRYRDWIQPIGATAQT